LQQACHRPHIAFHAVAARLQPYLGFDARKRQFVASPMRQMHHPYTERAAVAFSEGMNRVEFTVVVSHARRKCRRLKAVQVPLVVEIPESGIERLLNELCPENNDCSLASSQVRSSPAHS